MPLALLTYLVYTTQQTGEFAKINIEARDLPLLSFALLLITVASLFIFIRWYLLVRALDLEFSLLEAIRLGFLVELLNFVAPGSVGGDVFKAIYIARQQPDHRTQAVSSVLIDRVVGFYGLMVLPSIAVLATGVMETSTEQIRLACEMLLLLTTLATCGLMLLFSLPRLTASLAKRLAQLPMVGGILSEILEALPKVSAQLARSRHCTRAQPRHAFVARNQRVPDCHSISHERPSTRLAFRYHATDLCHGRTADSPGRPGRL